MKKIKFCYYLSLKATDSGKQKKILIIIVIIIILQPTFGMGEAKDPIMMYRQQILNENTPPMRIYVNRMKEEFSADVLTIYKKPNPGLNSTLRVKFENEAAVGEGPVREFFSTLMGFLHDGFPLDGAGQGQLTMIFEGQEDHKLPIPNALLRSKHERDMESTTYP